MNNNSETKGSCKDHKAQLVQIGAPAAPVYWQSVEELHNGPKITGEFPGGLPAKNGKGAGDSTRRDFLALMGFSLAAAGLAGCRGPVQNAIPLLVGSDDIVPGVANYYATTCRGCASSCSLVVKQRDGRPIKIEGNTESALFGNGTCATGQATVLSLYDDARFRGPLWHGQPAKWDEIDQHIIESLDQARAGNRKVVLLSSTINSPSTLRIIADFGKGHSNFSHVMYDAVSYSAIRAANRSSFGQAVIPHYSFDKARVIVGLEADFLGTWLSPVEFARQYAVARKPEGTPSLHIQFESGLSVTGSNADVRVPVAPSEIGPVAVALLRRIASKAGAAGMPEGPEPLSDPSKLDAVADELWKHRGESLIVSGSNDVSVQTVVNALNSMLGNVGKTIDLTQPSLQRTGDDVAMAELVEAMNRGEVHTLIIHGVNPSYDYAEAGRFNEALEKKVALSVSLSDRPDETTSRVQAICPDHHFLEAWGDAEPVADHFSLAQPLIAPLFQTRAAQESLLRWAGSPETNYYNYLREYWRQSMLPRQKPAQSFDVFWDRSLQDGVVVLSSGTVTHSLNLQGDWKTAAHTILQAAGQGAHNDDRYELHFYESVALRDGRHANNPWLQELPDPISKVTWGNYAAIAPSLADKLGLDESDVVQLKTSRGQIELPIFKQPGQHAHTISVAIGHGRTLVGKAGQNVGVNVFPLASLAAGLRSFSIGDVALEKTGMRNALGVTQWHFSEEGRPIVQETTLAELKEAENHEAKEEMPTLWAERLHGEHAWGMAIDMNACTGCSACVVACQAENNVPVVGKDQVQRQRIMHWIRIDRYYRGPEENPESVHQPMMCQHCQNAPCETVCPVLATTTSSEGLNQQVYNRCIGTRYCANNCPYKVRRFNWYNYTENSAFDFNMANPLGRMVLNPDVVVRSRGVMEKCSLCVQRIQLAKNVALQGKRELAEGDIKTACQQACPTQAIVFGDFKDPNSQVSQLRQSQRHYKVLEDLGVRPNVGYLKKVRNPGAKA